MAPWILVSGAQLYVRDDHVYRHVDWYDNVLDDQLGVSLARESFEGGEEAEHEKGGRTGGPWRS